MTDAHIQPDSSTSVLVVDDDAANLVSLKKILGREGLSVLAAGSGREALALMRKQRISVLLTDLMMPEVDGMELLRASRLVSPHTAVVVMTAYGTVETAVAAMKEGAYDFITKPLRRADVVRAVTRAEERANLRYENQSLRDALDRAGRSRDIIGGSAAMRRAIEMLERVAAARTTILLLGESGTGKEVFARALHRMSGRATGPFVAVNCAAIPESLIESELFGHERGAFTGAVARREGKFELADGGTLLLDEIGDLPLSMQGKLLRVLQENEIDRIGGSRPVPVNVRLVAATNRDLEALVEEGGFRSDLLYRLDVVAIELPPLRERGEDIPRLAHHFLRRFAAINDKSVQAFDADALTALQAWTWPGNVRELENAIERAVVLCRGDRVGIDDLPERIASAEAGSQVMHIAVGTPLEEIERLALAETLKLTGGDKRRAAMLLGIAVRTIYRKLDGTSRRRDQGGETDAATEDK